MEPSHLESDSNAQASGQDSDVIVVDESSDESVVPILYSDDVCILRMEKMQAEVDTKFLRVLKKIDAIKRVCAGESLVTVAEDIGVTKLKLFQWCKATEKIIKRARMLANVQLEIGRRSPRSVAAEEKFQAVEKVRNGESVAAIAHDIGVPISSLRAWCKLAEKIRNQSQNPANFRQTMSFASNNDNNSGSSSSTVNLARNIVNIVQPTKDEEAEVHKASAKE